MNISAYTLAFCQIVTGLLFLTTSINKLRDIHGFVDTIHRFRLIDSKLDRPLAYAFLIGELLVVAFMLAGGYALGWGFLLAASLLILFSIALSSVMLRRIQTSCNCSGSAQKQVTRYNVIRSALFTTCAIMGFLLSYQNGNTLTSLLSLLDWGLVFLVSIPFVFILMQLREIFQFLSILAHA